MGVYLKEERRRGRDDQPYADGITARFLNPDLLSDYSVSDCCPTGLGDPGAVFSFNSTLKELVGGNVGKFTDLQQISRACLSNNQALQGSHVCR